MLQQTNVQDAKEDEQQPSHYHVELERVAAKRTRRIDHYMHTTSRRIIDLVGCRRHWHAGHWQESRLEARVQDEQKE